MTGWRRRRYHGFYGHGYGYGPFYERTITGIVVGAVLDFIGALIGSVAGRMWRYRSELAPFAVAGITVWTAGFMHTHYRAWGWAFGAACALVVAVLAAFPSWWRRVRAIWLGRALERAYIACCVAIGGSWLTVAVYIGPGTGWLPGWALAGTILCAIPWWTSHRRREKVRVERILATWPDIADASGLTGTHPVSALVDAWGWTARIALPRGRTADTVISAVPAIESALGVRPGSVRAEPDRHAADRAYLRVIDRDPHAQTIGYRPPEPGTATITKPVPVGLWDDGSIVEVPLLRRNALVGGITDSGKSNVLNVILAYLAACPDVVVWGIDLKGGMELAPWAPCIARLATTPQQALKMLADAVTEISIREAEQVARGERLWNPDYDRPAIIIVIDEYAEMPDDAAEHADSIARLGRAVAVNLLIATQRPTQKAMRHNAVRSQMDVRICLRVRERRDVNVILGDGALTAGWNAHKLGDAGKFYISARGAQFSVPRPARAYLLTDNGVANVVADYGRYDTTIPADQPQDSNTDTDTDTTGTRSTDADGDPVARSVRTAVATIEHPPTPERLLLDALANAPEHGTTVPDLMTTTGKPRRWIYRRLEHLTTTGHVTQPTWGRWRTTRTPTTPPADHPTNDTTADADTDGEQHDP
jgi:S-DNA-T family DNA segregation ATPase FtsK/SpoIIIE